MHIADNTFDNIAHCKFAIQCNVTIVEFKWFESKSNNIFIDLNLI